MYQSKENIKNYSGKLAIFLTLNSIIFLIFALPKFLSVSHINKIYKEYFTESGLLSVSLIIIVFILNGLLTSDFKAKLVFWRRKNVYPGFRVFTELSQSDPRIDKNNLRQFYGGFPTDPIEQNKLWYKIYKDNENHSMIFESHRNFLLSRDLTGFSFILICLYPLSIVVARHIFEGSLKNMFWYLLFLIVQYVGFSWVSRIYGNRFACNVLAQGSHDKNS